MENIELQQRERRRVRQAGITLIEFHDADRHI